MRWCRCQERAGDNRCPYHSVDCSRGPKGTRHSDGSRSSRRGRSYSRFHLDNSLPVPRWLDSGHRYSSECQSQGCYRCCTSLRRSVRRDRNHIHCHRAWCIRKDHSYRPGCMHHFDIVQRRCRSDRWLIGLGFYHGRYPVAASWPR